MYIGRNISSSAPGMYVDLVLDRLVGSTLLQERLINYIPVLSNFLKKYSLDVSDLKFRVKRFTKSRLATELNQHRIGLGTQILRAYGRVAYHMVNPIEKTGKSIKFRTTINPFVFERTISSIELDDSEFLEIFYFLEINI